jgi:hypothetical protein
VHKLIGIAFWILHWKTDSVAVDEEAVALA